MRFIRRGEVLAKTGLSATTIYYMEQRGEFPRHVMLTARCAAWDEQDIDDWLEARKSGAVVAASGPVASPHKRPRVAAGGAL